MEVCDPSARTMHLTHFHLRWLFYIEGALTILVAVIAVFILPDFPQNSHWFLSSEEMRLAELRMQEDVGMDDSDEAECKGSCMPGLLAALRHRPVYSLSLSPTSLRCSLT